MQVRCPECLTFTKITDEQAWTNQTCARCPKSFRARPEAIVARLQATAERGVAPSGSRIVVLEDIRSEYNVGSMFRTADGTGWQHICLTGITATPINKGVRKTALGAHEFVSWSYHSAAVPLLDELRQANYHCVALEQTSDATALNDFVAPEKIALVVGNEVWGLSPEVLRRCVSAVQIPMRGQKRSLNAAVAFGIAAYLTAPVPK